MVKEKTEEEKKACREYVKKKRFFKIEIGLYLSTHMADCSLCGRRSWAGARVTNQFKRDDLLTPTVIDFKKVYNK